MDLLVNNVLSLTKEDIENSVISTRTVGIQIRTRNGGVPQWQI